MNGLGNVNAWVLPVTVTGVALIVGEHHYGARTLAVGVVEQE